MPGGDFIPEPGGFQAISRWLSAATPPDLGKNEPRTPQGCQRIWARFNEEILWHRPISVCIISSSSAPKTACQPSTHPGAFVCMITSVARCAAWKDSRGVGGVADHVHLLVGLKATHCLADVLRELKKASSVWVHEEIGKRLFAWQEGYASFTLSPTARGAVRKYIAEQENHHRKKSFREELVEMLAKAGIEYDPKYLE